MAKSGSGLRAHLIAWLRRAELMSKAKHGTEIEQRQAVEQLVATGHPAAAKFLGRTMYAEGSPVRELAGDGLGRMGPLSLPLLTRAMVSENAATKRAALRGLQQLRDRSTIPLLCKALGDSSEDVQHLAVETLGSMQALEALPDLIKLLDRHPARQVQRAAAIAIRQIDQDLACSTFLRWLGGDRTQREEALQAFVDWGGGAVPGLKRALSGKEREVRALAAQALQSLRWTPSRNVAGVRYCLATREHEPLRRFADVAVPILLDIAKEPDFDDRHRAALALGFLEDPHAVSVLTDLLRESPYVAWDLQKLGDPAAIPALLQLLGEEGDEPTQAVICALGTLGAREAIDSLVAILERRAQGNSDRVEEALPGRILGLDVVPGTMQVCSDGTENLARSTAWALGAIGDSAGVNVLARTLADTHVEVRQSAAEALAHMKAPSAVRALCQRAE